VQEVAPVLADVLADRRRRQHAPPRREQRIDDVRVVLHRQLEELHDAEDLEVPALVERGDVVLLPGLEPFDLRAEAQDLAARCGNTMFLGGMQIP
jgi:hypothetical protein